MRSKNSPNQPLSLSEIRPAEDEIRPAGGDQLAANSQTASVHLPRDSELTITHNSPYQAEISEIFKSPEFAYAILATMFANTHHNDHNQFQNEEALRILQEFAKKSPDQTLAQNVLELSKFSRTSKQSDRNYSFISDVVRFTAGAVALSASIYESSAKRDEAEGVRLESAAELAQIISLAMQVIASPVTANKGYQAAITGHLANEMADAFKRVSSLIRNKIDKQELGKSTQNCSNPNHHHEALRPSNGEDTHVCEHGHEHGSHAGSKERHLGTFLNVGSMTMAAVRIASELQHLTGSDRILSNLNSSILSLVAPILTLTGKSFSFQAAKIRENEIGGRISVAQEEMSENFAKIFEKIDELGLVSASVSIEDAKSALKAELVVIGRKMEEEMAIKRQQSGIATPAKLWSNYLKDSIYGLSYEAIKLVYSIIPGLLVPDSSVRTQPQLSQTLQDLESHTETATSHLHSFDNLKRGIAQNYRLSASETPSLLALQEKIKEIAQQNDPKFHRKANFSTTKPKPKPKRKQFGNASTVGNAVLAAAFTFGADGEQAGQEQTNQPSTTVSRVSVAPMPDPTVITSIQPPSSAMLLGGAVDNLAQSSRRQSSDVANQSPRGRC